MLVWRDPLALYIVGTTKPTAPPDPGTPMSEADNENELGGIARSIDSLFGGGPKPSEPLEPAEDAETTPAEGPEAVDLGGTDLMDAETEEAPADGDTEDALSADSESESRATSEEEGETGEDDGDPIGTGEADLALADPDAADPDATALDENSDSPPDLRIVEVTAAAADDVDRPGELALAVESYLAGGGGEERVEELVEHDIAKRDYDAVAEAVERLVTAADGDRGAPSCILAESLLTPMVRSRLVQRLGQERSEARLAEYFALCTTLGEEMARAIRDALAEADDRHARRTYFDALVAMEAVSRPIVHEMAEDENRFLARNAVGILAELGGDDAGKAVVAALANTDPRVRREAALAIAKLGVEDADQLIVGLFDDSEASVREAATVAAGELRLERAVRPLVAFLEEAYDADEVLPLLHALGQIADPGAVPAIEKHAVKELFAKPRTGVRIAAYQALAHIGTPHARRLLNQALNDKDSEVKAAVKDLLHLR